MLRTGDPAPSFTLHDCSTGGACSDPWSSGEVVLAFFKATCPVCQMAAPKVQALADGGLRVVAVGEDPPAALERYSEDFGQRVPTLSEPAPYAVSQAFGIDTVPTLFLVGADGVVTDGVVAWDRDGFNRIAVAGGAAPVSHDGDGLPAFRPG